MQWYWRVLDDVGVELFGCSSCADESRQDDGWFEEFFGRLLSEEFERLHGVSSEREVCCEVPDGVFVVVGLVPVVPQASGLR